MLSILTALLVGWLWTLVGLDNLFHHVVGFTITQYYFMWFGIGFVVWINRIFKS